MKPDEIKHLSEDEYYDMLHSEQKENRASVLALVDKADFEIIKNNKTKYNEKNIKTH